MALDYQENNGPKGFIEMIIKLNKSLDGVPKFSNKLMIDGTSRVLKPTKSPIEYNNADEFVGFVTPTTSKAIDYVYESSSMEVFFRTLTFFSSI